MCYWSTLMKESGKWDKKQGGSWWNSCVIPSKISTWSCREDLEYKLQLKFGLTGDRRAVSSGCALKFVSLYPVHVFHSCYLPAHHRPHPHPTPTVACTCYSLLGLRWGWRSPLVVTSKLSCLKAYGIFIPWPGRNPICIPCIERRTVDPRTTWEAPALDTPAGFKLIRERAGNFENLALWLLLLWKKSESVSRSVESNSLRPYGP